ncbi:SPOR domain-containing protein [Oricola thermophila]|uniref:SPOR domain-containing protein n=1 Tax=Oricola thermophila TaxID=2742145 RepID=A0A6N1VF37_9HYPH|nr:SPOR domain-containing protein [Oricola thermophila]QKV17749.1 SPOR domain-containing protein [Oricola thermophila]
MTDATNRKLDVGNTGEDRISRDDPLFELSQIIGYSEPEAAADADPDADDGQMDLEDALLRELGDFSASIEGESVGEVEAAVAEVEEAVNAAHGIPETPASAYPEAPVAGYSEAPETEHSEPPAAEYAETPEAEHPGEPAYPDEVEPQYAEAPAPAYSGAPETDYPDAPSSAYPRMPEAPVAEDPRPAAEAESHSADAGSPGTLEAELIDLLGNLGDDAGVEWSNSPAPAQSPSQTETFAQVPASAPVWYDQDEPAAPARDEPAGPVDEDAEILDAFESALNEGLAISFDEGGAEAPAAAHEVAEGDGAAPASASAETDVESTYVSDIEAAVEEIASQAAPPVVETAELPAADIEPMQPLDLPELPDVEDKASMAVDIERELDAALSGYDQFDSMRDAAETAEAKPEAEKQDSGLDLDMGSFETALARDLEFVDHDMSARDDTPAAAPVAGAAVADAIHGEEPRSKRGMMIAAAVGGVAILGAIAAFGLSSDNGVDSGAPVLVKADPEPVKIVPEDPGGKQVPNQDRAVYSEVDGNGETVPTQETLVSTSEEPIDLNAAGAPILPNAVAETAKIEDRLTPDAADDIAESATPVLAPRRVRTVIVKPDGTLVENQPAPEQPVVAAAPEPAPTIPTPDAPVRPIETTTVPAAPDVASSPAPVGTSEAIADSSTTEAATAEQLAAIAEPEVSEPLATQAGEATAPAASEPVRAPVAIPERPSDQPVTIVGGVQQPTRQVASAPAAQAPSPAPAAAAPSQVAPGSYMVQIASQPSAELAQQSAADLARRFANVIGNRQVTIQQAEIEGRGTYHRVRIVANGRQDAVAVCERLKQEGGSCFVAR